MAFKLIGDGTLTSSVAISTLNLTNQYPAIPDPFTYQPRDLVLETDSGYIHGYNLGTARRQFPISLRLLTFANYRLLQTIFGLMGNRNWVFWEWWSGTATGTSDVLVSASSSGMDAQQLTSNWFKDQIVVIKSTTDTNAPQGEKRRTSSYTVAGSAAWSVTAFSAAVDSGDTFAVGYPVRLVGDVRRQTPDGTLYNVDFTFEEVLFDGTG